MRGEVPTRAELEEEVDIIGGFGEVAELDDMRVMDGLPGFDLILERVDEILLRQGLILGEVDLIDQVLLFDHLAGQHLSRLGIHRQVGLREAPLAQFLILDRVVTVHYLQRMQLLHHNFQTQTINLTNMARIRRFMTY